MILTPLEIIFSSKLAEPYRSTLLVLYHDRACLVCKEAIWCQHREPEFDLAELYRAERIGPSLAVVETKVA